MEAARGDAPRGGAPRKLYFVFFCLGLSLAALLPDIPDFIHRLRPLLLALALLPALYALLIRASNTVSSSRLLHGGGLIAALLVGFVLSSGDLAQRVSARLPAAHHGNDLHFTFEITSVVAMDAPDPVFTARVVVPDAGRILSTGDRIRLAWYRIEQENRQLLRAGNVLQATVRLKPPRGTVNPGVFDYDGWLLRKNIVATGYIRTKEFTPRKGQGPDSISRQLNVLRQDVYEWISGPNNAALERSGLIAALLLGIRDNVPEDATALLRRTGTSHLLAISGMHIGLVAGLAWFVAGMPGRLLAVLPCGPSRGHWLAGFSAISAAGAYALLAGAPLSAQRAWLMASMGVLFLMSRRRTDGWSAFWFAACVVLLLEPLSVFDPGFWLSFCAVAILLARFAGRRAPAGTGQGADRGAGAHNRLLTASLQLLRAQWAIGLGLLPLSLMYFSGISTSGFVANLFAIPLVSLLIMPMLFLSVVTAALPFAWVEFAAARCLAVTDSLLGFLMAGLRQVDSLAGNLSTGWMAVPEDLLGLPVVLCGLTAVAVLGFLPPRFPAKPAISVMALGLLCWLLVDRPVREGLQLDVLDVGQGLAMVIRTAGKTLVWDTGVRFPGGFNSAEAVIEPFLRHQGVRTIDLLVVSHDDSDHAGGSDYLLRAFPVTKLLAPGGLAAKYARRYPGLAVGACHSSAPNLGYGSLSIEWLWPASVDSPGTDNAHSCVGLLQYRSAEILLPGDIDRDVELKLGGLGEVDLLVAAHHGSRYSSSWGLLQKTRPRYTVYSAGYRHRFRHPHPNSVERARAVGSSVYSTALSGALSFNWHPDGMLEVEEARRSQKRFWYTLHSL
ncbi:DNA internalization-related competence protein ComEC/Rec2 [Biformimicrobium ophioploci]|uniref:DNA internalization-related competence protein ComEC/Rec2 n=1 Tax=Biformimicrobium ophioploci TaxID=3036711 RepID=A0ABQ6M1V3_9GAMM|nr:DNA internalization-related competence protein ComEC/Rec2 [Microbulbifer sp. NKW57]GMG88264.1 DNA internalization-related competence protein ComEC/Rec2 [Microbulbifer sp. NKW57]